MSEDLKKHVRTQGKYSDLNKSKTRDKRQRISPAAKELAENKTRNRYSNESKRSSNSFTDEDVGTIKYEENSDHSFNQLEDPKPPVEIKLPGNHVISSTTNGDSKIFYEPCFLKEDKADQYFHQLYEDIDWYSKNIIINGEEKPQPRMVSWFGPYPYSYSGATLEPAEMPDSVLEIKRMVEECLKKNNINATFNSVLLNLYRTNKDSVAWHSDDESTMGIFPTIASVSLGETRRFELRPKKKQIEDESPREKPAQFFVHLMNGSLIVMDGCMQDDWQHRIPKEYHDKGVRINLTFRTVYSLERGSHKYSARVSRRKDVDTWNSHKVSNFKNSFATEDFPPLSSGTSPAGSGKESDIHEASNSSWNSDVHNKSEEVWDSETSVDVKVKVEKDDPKTSLNVLAKEFVPNNAPAWENQSTNYGSISLEDLLYYEVKLMHGRRLQDFSYYMKLRLTERFPVFPRFDREELEFLCLITDGSQTEKNQKLITSRMVKIASKNLEQLHKYSNTWNSYDRPRGYGKSNDGDNVKRSYHYQKRVIDCKVRWQAIRESLMKNSSKRSKTESPATAKSEYDGDKLQFLKDDIEKRQIRSGFEKPIPEEPTINSTSLHGTSMSPMKSSDRKATVVLTDHNDGMEPPRKRQCYSSRDEILNEFKKGRDECNTTRQKDLLHQKQAAVAPFFRSMEQTVSQLPVHLIAEAMLKVRQTVSELEMRAMNEKSCSSNNNN